MQTPCRVMIFRMVLLLQPYFKFVSCGSEIVTYFNLLNIAVGMVDRKQVESVESFNYWVTL
jgi:hypothetical protein